jgi:putative glutamine amidotransferase
LAQALGEGNVNINSFHHQALGDVPDSLQVVATSDDGIIEAVYAPESAYAVGLQWHPERLAAEHAEHQALFDNLVRAAESFAEGNH